MLAQYDIIVVGGGHAGCEAAVAAARMDMQTLLVTSDVTKIAQMSCNPSIGGIAKGQIVREIDALGGCTGIVTDACTLQFRMLNRSKGPAMHSPRAQCDRDLYSLRWREIIDSCSHLQLIQDTIESLILDGGRCIGVVAKHRGEITSQRVILTAGTFLNGIVHIGLQQTPGGRIDEAAVDHLSEQLGSLGVERLRFKTGTSPRIDIRSVDLSKLGVQEGDTSRKFFSYRTKKDNGLIQRPCYIGYTNTLTHTIIRDNLDKSPLYQKKITGRGPRYCPSIEDKIRIFSGKDEHQLFLEPEGTWSNTVYINGFSCSLPYSIQEQALHTIRGLEETHIIRPGYAIEYDFFNPRQLHASLESRIVPNLYIAGQLNGTTGYEEAAAQGLIAGINAVRSLRKEAPFILSRRDAFIGVMIDDLIQKGVDEPYRMFTSRAENRLSLRQDNADQRLSKYGFQLGLLDKEQYEATTHKYRTIEKNVVYLQGYSLAPTSINPFLSLVGSSNIKQKTKASQILLRPEIHLESLREYFEDAPSDTNFQNEEILQSTEIAIKYEKYIEREEGSYRIDSQLEKMKISDTLDINSIGMLSIETKEKITKYRPSNLLEMSRIPGIKPSDISAIIIAMNHSVPRGTK